MAFTPVKSYTFGGGLRATDSSGPIATKQQYQYPTNFGSLYGLLNPGTTNPLAGFNTSVNAGSGASPSDAARAQVGAGGGFNPPTVDQLANDPILQQIRAAGQMQVQNAQQGALSGSENAIIGYGSTDVPQSLKDLYAGDTSNPILAALADANTASAAAANPDSTLKQLARTDVGNNAAIDQNENSQNLFYSSDRGNKLGGEAGDYRAAQGRAAQSLAGLLGQENAGVLSAEQNAQDNYLNGLSGAWDRWLTMQKLLGPTPTPTVTPDPTASGANSLGLYVNPYQGTSTDLNYYKPSSGLKVYGG